MVIGNVKPWTLYRVKHKVLTPTLGQYKEDFKKLDQWMSKFVNLNTNSCISEKICEEDNTFEGVYLSHSQMIWANHNCGLGFHAIDT